MPGELPDSHVSPLWGIPHGKLMVSPVLPSGTHDFGGWMDLFHTPVIVGQRSFALMGPQLPEQRLSQAREALASGKVVFFSTTDVARKVTHDCSCSAAPSRRRSSRSRTHGPTSPPWAPWAQPRTRRKVAASHAATIGLVGAVLGAAVGFVPGLAVSYPLTGAEWAEGIVTTDGTALPDHFLDIPWLLIGALVVALPLLTATVVGLCSRSRLPMVGRLS